MLEYDKNEVLVDALGGDLSKPEWNYRADLYVDQLVTLLVFADHNLIAMCLVHLPLLYLHICAQPNVFKGKMTWGTIFSWLG